MCGRYVAPDDAALERAFRLDRRATSPFTLRYNVAPTTAVPLVRRAADGALELLEARWGLIPGWWKQDKAPALSFNARSEEAAGKPMWREPLRRSRGLMPALGWYEWQERDRATGAPLKPRLPHYLHAGELACFAALWSYWRAPSGNRVLSCALLSRAASGPAAEVHERMPVVLQPADYEAWLDPATQEPAALEPLFARARTAGIRWHRVGLEVNKAANDNPGLILPAAPAATAGSAAPDAVAPAKAGAQSVSAAAFRERFKTGFPRPRE